MCNISDLAGQDRTKACAVIQHVGALSWEITMGKAILPWFGSPVSGTTTQTSSWSLLLLLFYLGLHCGGEMPQ